MFGGGGIAGRSSAWSTIWAHEKKLVLKLEWSQHKSSGGVAASEEHIFKVRKVS